MTNNLNVSHNVTLTEGQISVILYHLEGKDGKEINNIFQILEGKIDSYYESNSESNKNLSEIVPERDAKAVENNTSKVIITPDNLTSQSDNEASEIDTLIDNDSFVEHTSECS